MEVGSIFDKSSGMKRLQIRMGHARVLAALVLLWILSTVQSLAQDDVPQQRPASRNVESAVSSKSNVPKRQESKQISAVASDGFTPVSFAVVLNKNTGQQVMTDADGNASITRSMASDTLLVRSVGFMDMVILPGQPLPPSIRMIEDLISLETAQVVSQGLVDASSASLSTQAHGDSEPQESSDSVGGSADSRGVALVDRIGIGAAKPAGRGFTYHSRI